MDFKTGKLHKVIKEFQKGSGSYEINGVDLKNTVFLYREKTSPFVPIPKGNYRTVFNENENTLVVDESINNKAIEFQVISVFDIQSSKYLEKFPELKMLVDHTNKMVDDINNIIEYLNSVGIKSDSKFQTQILTPLEPSSTWYMNADGIIDTLPIDDFNKKFKEIIEKISETVDKKAIEQVQEKLELLKSQIETFKSAKITEITENISAEKIKSLKEIDNKISIANNNFSEIFNAIDTKKYNSIREINEVKDSSKRELDSRMPEINNKFNAIAGGQLNPSFIQDVGEKRTGQFYLDRNTGRLHKCIKLTSSNINSTEYFEDASISSIMNKLENLKRTQKVLWRGASNEIEFYITNVSPHLTFNNVHSITIIGNVTCTLPNAILKSLPNNEEIILGFDNGVRSDATFYFKKINETLGVFGTKGVVEDIGFTGYNTLIVEY